MNLAELLHPMTPEEFAQEYWEKEPVIIRGAAGRFRGLFGSTDIASLVHYLRPKPGQGMMLVKGSKHADVNWITPDGMPKLDKVREAWRDGYSIVVNDLGKLWAPVGELQASLQEQLHHNVHVNLYLTPSSSQAFVPHFDIMDVFVLQVEGSKRWQLRGAAADLPFEDEHTDVPAAQLPPVRFEEDLLEGDVLYIPRGFVHAAKATTETSLHLSVGVNITRWIDLLTAAVKSMRGDARLRQALPPGFLNGGADGMRATFDEMLAILPRETSLDQALSQLAEDLLVKKPAPPAGEGMTSEDVEVGPETVVARRPGVICRVFEGPGYAGVQYSGGKMVGPPKILQAVRHIADHRRFPVRELAGDLSEKETLVLVRRLMRDGVLTLG
ncbi:MAG: bifunctional lysine-specific demethylase and histidyl-hydroxylase [Thermoanaerobaculia bacterium]|jgi:ribosomal protein L16 Arg81 hydroxylase|nr:bifunctional lysine-specific demethylase and histidyl-hydroxylase [Thermoanaerobaculia bacterium]